MIFVTGDLHGDYDVYKLRFGENKELDQATKEDYLMICGDFGMVWDDSPTDLWWRKWLDELPYTVLFIDGNHENFDLLDAYPTEEWHGGLIQRIMPSVLHLMRGQVYEIDGKTFFTMGGAQSHDVAQRVEGESWWKQELPSEEEISAAREKLDQYNWTVDYVLTHSLPTSLEESVFEEFDYPHNRLTDFFDEVEQKLAYRNWFTGHYHQDARLACNPQMILLYNYILKLDDD